MKKTLIALFLICSLLLTGCSPLVKLATDAVSPEPTIAGESTITPLLYQVTDERGHTLWLFGSIHVGREDFYPLPEYVKDAFRAADSLAVEFDIVAYQKDLPAQMRGMSLLVYPDGSTIRDHIDPELYETAAEFLKDSPLPISVLDRYKPMMWASLIEGLSYETDTVSARYGIDMNLIGAAYDMDKPVISIESADSQYAMMGGMSPQLQELILSDAVVARATGADTESLHVLLDLWAQGDEAAFASYLSETGEIPEDTAPLYEEYETAMLTDRNLLMTDFAERALLEGKSTFICVGAAHVVGEGAMVQLLRQRGYTVTKLS